MLDVFRFAWFALRTFAGFVLLVLTLYAALWAFVKIDSMATRNVDHHAALRLVKVADHRNEVRRSRVEHDRGLGRAQDRGVQRVELGNVQIVVVHEVEVPRTERATVR